MATEPKEPQADLDDDFDDMLEHDYRVDPDLGENYVDDDQTPHDEFISALIDRLDVIDTRSGENSGDYAIWDGSRLIAVLIVPAEWNHQKFMKRQPYQVIRFSHR